MRNVYKTFRLFAWAMLLLLAFIVACNVWVVQSTEDKIFYSLQGLPSNDAALVLGTTKRLSKGRENPFFNYRMEAAAQLYHQRKVKYLILSGDNGSNYYNEPWDMRKALMKLGVPETALTLDYAGFRTFDSVIRCKEVFNQNRITIISQAFHDSRALFICQRYNIQAVAFAARDVSGGQSLKTLMREYLARPKAILDIYVLKASPKFLGESAQISAYKQ
ncbi:MAG: ElyC/SanA/YdcF family protein [Bacteroidota bacterium]